MLQYFEIVQSVSESLKINQILIIFIFSDRITSFEKQFEQLQAFQQLQQKGNDDLNNIYTDLPDIQITVGLLTALQPSSGSQNPGLDAGQRLKDTGSISAGNRERADPQINEGHDDNADEEEDEQTDEAALNQNKDYRVNAMTQPQVEENLGTQSQNVRARMPKVKWKKMRRFLLQLEYRRNLKEGKEVKKQKQKA
ncbi:MAG: hypothetical protein EZS28_032161 [Streblomastix strix]|uniref:Uncharacterized protein n=1 Tax=Streblomastix strix TaxID=222440 RepID=A0A5J4UQ42_9EUKA|nr:MAG: hypothetical protein EZS28_032161 [Streblomastix strix]